MTSAILNRPNDSLLLQNNPDRSQIFDTHVVSTCGKREVGQSQNLSFKPQHIVHKFKNTFSRKTSFEHSVSTNPRTSVLSSARSFVPASSDSSLHQTIYSQTSSSVLSLDNHSSPETQTNHKNGNWSSFKEFISGVDSRALEKVSQVLPGKNAKTMQERQFTIRYKAAVSDFITELQRNHDNKMMEYTPQGEQLAPKRLPEGALSPSGNQLPENAIAYYGTKFAADYSRNQWIATANGEEYARGALPRITAFKPNALTNTRQAMHAYISSNKPHEHATKVLTRTAEGVTAVAAAAVVPPVVVGSAALVAAAIPFAVAGPIAKKAALNMTHTVKQEYNEQVSKASAIDETRPSHAHLIKDRANSRDTEKLKSRYQAAIDNPKPSLEPKLPDGSPAQSGTQITINVAPDGNMHWNALLNGENVGNGAVTSNPRDAHLIARSIHRVADTVKTYPASREAGKDAADLRSGIVKGFSPVLIPGALAAKGAGKVVNAAGGLLTEFNNGIARRFTTSAPNATENIRLTPENIPLPPSGNNSRDSLSQVEYDESASHAASSRPSTPPALLENGTPNGAYDIFNRAETAQSAAPSIAEVYHRDNIASSSAPQLFQESSQYEPRLSRISQENNVSMQEITLRSGISRKSSTESLTKSDNISQLNKAAEEAPLSDQRSDAKENESQPISSPSDDSELPRQNGNSQGTASSTPPSRGSFEEVALARVQDDNPPMRLREKLNQSIPPSNILLEESSPRLSMNVSEEFENSSDDGGTPAMQNKGKGRADNTDDISSHSAEEETGSIYADADVEAVARVIAYQDKMKEFGWIFDENGDIFARPPANSFNLDQTKMEATYNGLRVLADAAEESQHVNENGREIAIESSPVWRNNLGNGAQNKAHVYKQAFNDLERLIALNQQHRNPFSRIGIGKSRSGEIKSISEQYAGGAERMEKYFDKMVLVVKNAALNSASPIDYFDHTFAEKFVKEIKPILPKLFSGEKLKENGLSYVKHNLPQFNQLYTRAKETAQRN